MGVRILKMLTGALTGALSAVRRHRERGGKERSCPPQDLMPVSWGVAPHLARRLDAAGCRLVEAIRNGGGNEHHIASSLRMIRDLLHDFNPDKPDMAMLWILLQDACRGTEFEFKSDTLWKAFLVEAIPE